MMKTVIRRGVFETNSSSTHSFTIQNKKSEYKILREGVLYPEEVLNLRDEIGDETYVIKCDTFETKLSLLLLVIYNDFSYNDGKLDTYDKLLEYLERKYHIEKIERPSEGIYTEDGLPLTSNDIDELIEILSDYFNQCEDDNVEFIHKETGW